MTDMEKVKIHGVPETMMQTLFARHHSVGSDGGCLFRGTSGCNCC